MTNPYLLNIIGLGFDIFGAFLIAYYIMNGGTVGFQKHERFIKFVMKKSNTGTNPFEESERWIVIIGFIFLFIGFVLQAYSNWLQYIA
jgi:hypothetical protein